MKSTALPTDFKAWLSRPPKVKKGARKRVRQVSLKRERENRIYSVKRRAFLQAHPFCDAWRTIVDKAPVSTLVWGGHTHIPQARPPSEEIHHTRKPKQTYFLDESTWLAVSRWAHDWIEDHKSTARQLGLLK
jgi:hypothetical protein